MSNALVRATENDPAARAEFEALLAEIERFKVWVNDLQSGMFLNCVFCGHRFGASREHHPREMLIDHMARCPNHPLAALLRVSQAAHHALGSMLAVRDGMPDEALDRLRGEIAKALEAAKPAA